MSKSKSKPSNSTPSNDRTLTLSIIASRYSLYYTPTSLLGFKYSILPTSYIIDECLTFCKLSTNQILILRTATFGFLHVGLVVYNIQWAYSNAKYHLPCATLSVASLLQYHMLIHFIISLLRYQTIYYHSLFFSSSSFFRATSFGFLHVGLVVYNIQWAYPNA